ncbi:MULTISPECIES: DUF2264 domain-containing protein [Sphingobium]|uniref:DUF2264 domain-containing protein n=1 Tax=Sphingobium yanoikuyae ATCC 51230 TaxID=883163 RepID=K9CT04_SPHYA|nr:MULTISPECIES: DUF2264 domain-containing protein [Sphingobium]EKU74061.1 hypothetical protein HMPREF9718_03178 [Sphingobium yanoikuyae ATCC 51230]WQE07512.1 DUF2264 domain-containing protein [Sphingobium yanoikuyae]SHM70395.1 hypothetical protein SAMN05518668_1212 [Sphingobium sp. YR657]
MTSHIDRRAILTGMATGTAAFAAMPSLAKAGEAAPVAANADDRSYALALLERMASPVLSRMARGQLQAQWRPELSPTWDGRNPKVAFLEAFGRLIDGIAPWLALPDTDGAEGRLRARLRGQALASYAHSVDPKSPDYLLWQAEGQPLVDSAYFTSALLRAPQTLWDPLDRATKDRIIKEIQGLRRVAPPYTNWLLFAAMNEVFLLSVGAQWDPIRVDLALRKFSEWYVGDGWYADGEHFHFDMYNSYVIHPMLTQIWDVLVRCNARFNALDPKERLAIQIQRMQRFGEALERMIGPDGAFPPVGRSLTYRTAVHQPLAYLAWRKLLHAKLPEGQVRAATMATQRRIFADPSNFDADGFLTIGFARHQPSLGDVYSNAGSMYITSESLLALGLPASDSYWTVPAQPWTMRKAYEGQDFPKDYYIAN